MLALPIYAAVRWTRRARWIGRARQAARVRGAALVRWLAPIALLHAPSAAQSPLTELSIPPLATEPALSGWTAAHFACWDPAIAPRPELFVFLHGLDGAPGAAKELIRTAARDGYRALGLTYPCAWVPFEFCNTSPDPDCYEDLRREIAEGVDHSPWIHVPAADSIENRLVKLLAYLQTQHPSQSWASFVDGDEPRWDRVALWGHSQGGANAAVLARHHAVARAILSAPPADFSQALGGYAPWWSAHATPSAAYRGFVHVQDGLTSKLAVWSLLGMSAYGPVADVAGAVPPYCFTHQLDTSLAPALAGQFHNSVVTDATTPKLPGGAFAYAPTWSYLISGGDTDAAPLVGADVSAIATAAGGAQHWCVDAGPQHAGDLYWILGSLSGTAPGLDVGGVHVPLNVDAWTLVTLSAPNQGPLSASLGVLDALGRAQGSLNLPAGLDSALIGAHADHAAALIVSWAPAAATNAIGLDLAP